MEKRILPAILLLILIAATCINCKRKTISTDPCANVACTALFGMINIKVTNSSGTNVVLDDNYTIRTDNNDTIRSSQQVFIDSSYTVLDDNYLVKMRNSSHNFRFIGIKNGKKVVDEAFVISADCCHITKQSGQSPVIANL